MTVPNDVPEPAGSAQHPTWCHLGLCAAGTGGPHRSRTELIPMPGPGEGMLQVDLAQQPGADSQVRISLDGEPRLSLPPNSAFLLGLLVAELARLGRAER